MTYADEMKLEDNIYDFVKTVLHEHEKTTGRPVQIDAEISIAIDALFYALRDCMK